jgi:hypothetical protein
MLGSWVNGSLDGPQYRIYLLLELTVVTGSVIDLIPGAIEHFGPLLMGENPFGTEHVWQILVRGGSFPARRALT